MKAMATSCGVIVGDGERILLGHATRSPRWDIPKGGVEPGEGFAEAAARELQEETGLIVPPAELAALGVYSYLRGKDLALFAWTPPALPDPNNLVCNRISRWLMGHCSPNSIASACSRGRRRCAGSARAWRRCCRPSHAALRNDARVVIG